MKTEDVLQTIGERPASVQKQDAALTTEQVQELKKAKMAIEHVLQQAEQQETDQTEEEPVQKVLEQVVAPIRHQLSSLEKSASREKAALEQVLQRDFCLFQSGFTCLKKRAVCQNKQSTIHKTTVQSPYGMAYYKPK